METARAMETARDASDAKPRAVRRAYAVAHGWEHASALRETQRAAIGELGTRARDGREERARGVEKVREQARSRRHSRTNSYTAGSPPRQVTEDGSDDDDFGDDVVMEQSGCVDEFHHSGKANMGLTDLAQGFGRQQHKQRAHSFSASLNNVMTDVLDHVDVGLQKFHDDIVDLREFGRDAVLDRYVHTRSPISPQV